MQPRKVLPELPASLKRIIGDADLVQNKIGWSKALVFHLPERKSYLKIALHQDYPDSLAYEAEVLRWLQGKLPVPQVHYYQRHRDAEYLLMSEVEGLDASRETHRRDPEGLVRLLALGLREMHSLEIGNCPFDQTLQVKIEKARSNVERGLVDENDLEPQYRGKPVQDLYALLLASLPESQDLVFTHGDYCLPNVMIQDGKLSGFIDLGRAGVSDRYVDLALAVRSLQYNGYGAPELVELFFQTYGLEDLDQAKMEFFTLLDEFM